MSSSEVPHRLIAVAEVDVPYEAIFACFDNRDDVIMNIVPPVKIVRDREPRLSATLKIFAVNNTTAYVEIETYECSRRLHFLIYEKKRNKPVKKPCRFGGERYVVGPRHSIRSEVLDGKTDRLSTVDLVSVSCFTVTLKMVDLSAEPPVPALARGLNEARLRGDPQCDAFLCVEGAELPAHRVVLTTQSQVFTKMFEGSFKEAHDGRVPLKDTTKEAAEAFLEYLYTGDVEDYNDLELELLDMAERYGVDGLKHECRLRLWTVDAPRALRLLASPLVEDMKERFAQIVMDNWNVVSESEKLFIQEMQKEQPLAAYYFLRAASTPPALSFPQTLASPVAVFKRKPRLGRESCEQPEEQPEDQPLLGEPSDWVVADDWAAAGDPGEWAVDGDPGDAGDWGPQDWA